MVEAQPQSIGKRPVAGRYRLKSVLKETAREQTYLAEDLVAGGTVVLRVAAADLASAVELRLTHEAALLSKLSSTRLAPLLDFGREEDHFYWARPHIPGVALAELIQQPISLEQALEV